MAARPKAASRPNISNDDPTLPAPSARAKKTAKANSSPARPRPGWGGKTLTFELGNLRVDEAGRGREQRPVRGRAESRR